MDPEKSAPFELGRGEDALLLVHGFTGSPWDMRPLGEAMAARGYFVKAIRLPGHGLTPEAMAHVTWRDWEAAVFGALDQLRSYRRVFLSGLSVGGLLSVIAAARRPEQVSAIALMAPAVRLRKRLVRLMRATRRLPFLPLVYPWIHKDVTDIADPEALREAPILEAWPTARLYDIWTLQDRALEAVAEVRAAALVLLAEHDHVIDTEAAAGLARGMIRSPEVRLVRLPQGFHVMPRDFGRERIVRELDEFFSRVRAG